MDLVTPAWITALRGIGVVCNIYNIAKTSDDVIEGLEEKMGWNQRRRAKKKINRHYNSRTKKLNCERKDTISMMKHGDPNWKDMITLPYEREGFTVGDLDLSNQIDSFETNNANYGSGLDRVISDEPDKEQIIRRTIEGIQELRISIETHNKCLRDYETEVKKNVGVDDRVAKRYVAEIVNLEKSREDHQLHLATLKMGLGRLRIEGHDRDRVELGPVYEGLSVAIKSSDRLLDYGMHRTASGALDKLNEAFEIERGLDDSFISSLSYASEIDERLEQYQTEARSNDSAKATAIKKSSDLESLVIKAKAQAGV
jgi:hypothetical protein